jgi:cellulose biosynthesis protein BcsQ
MGGIAARANSRQRPLFDRAQVKTENKNPPPPFIAFYSFKGGVGRSMALINAACILAGHGRRVLAIDLDLEAPGISYLLLREKPEPQPAKGFIDFIYDLLSRGAKSPLAHTSNPKALLSYTAELPLPKTLQKVPGGSLRIMPAGRIDANYEKRRQAIDLHRLYLEQKGEPLIRHLRTLIIESNAFDYVLIDSRTGFADEAGISVRDLADHLMVLHGLNHQNIEGTARFLGRFKKRVIRAKKMKIAFVANRPGAYGVYTLRSTLIKCLNRC